MTDALLGNRAVVWYRVNMVQCKENRTGQDRGTTELHENLKEL